ncbi:hypothetical protein FOZ63_023842, partial [Perkinsus olseni]
KVHKIKSPVSRDKVTKKSSKKSFITTALAAAKLSFGIGTGGTADSQKSRNKVPKVSTRRSTTSAAAPTAPTAESVAAPDPSDPPFPPMKYADGMPELRGGIVCGYGDGKARDGNSRSFSFNFQADRGAQTEEIICPETPRL